MLFCKETIKGYGHQFSLSLICTFLHLHQIYLEVCAPLLLAVMVELALPVHHVRAPAMELHFPLSFNIINVVWVRNMKINEENNNMSFHRKAREKSWRKNDFKNGNISVQRAVKWSNPLNYSVIPHRYKVSTHLTEHLPTAPTGEFIIYDFKWLYTGLHNPPCPHPKEQVFNCYILWFTSSVIVGTGRLFIFGAQQIHLHRQGISLRNKMDSLYYGCTLF